MSPSVPKAYLEARMAEIMEAAIKCFMENGFHNTTMQDIYRATSLSPGAVYNYFENKEDIVTAAVKLSQKRNSDAIASAASGMPEEALSKLGQIYFSCARETDLARAASFDFDLYSESVRNPRIHEILRVNHYSTLKKLVEVVKHNQRLGVLSDSLDAMAIARVLFSILIGTEIHKALDSDLDLDSYSAVFEAIVKGTFSHPRKGSQRSRNSGMKSESREREGDRQSSVSTKKNRGV